MLTTSKNVLFPGNNHLVTTGTDDPTLIIGRAPVGEGSSVPLVSRWLYIGNMTFLKVMVTWGKVAIFCIVVLTPVCNA